MSILSVTGHSLLSYYPTFSCLLHALHATGTHPSTLSSDPPLLISANYRSCLELFSTGETYLHISLS
ncbi:hypothetical protein L873DRAFT_789987 [Choiromyces venosus 120613-1]|uniref:Uncharacterized protein n=1 Tax=Choiromyces venosus 120613-1 TaxID=1336337 RepID=A0A3N4K4D5_9PEZI|nr:hypothetical protein L873DRAFT_789987 [Choiromyces venosus 120613-1]